MNKRGIVTELRTAPAKVFKTKEFKAEDLRELSGMDVGEEWGDWKSIINDMVDTTRWSIQYYQIFEYQGVTYETSYQRGATENQDEQPYEYENEMITCYEVKAHEVKTVKYKKIEV